MTAISFRNSEGKKFNLPSLMTGLTQHFVIHKGFVCNIDRSCHRLCNALLCGIDRRQGSQERNGNCQNELRQQRRIAVLCAKYYSACGLDSHHDL